MELAGFKLFEDRLGEPCTLVHGMPVNDKRSRILPLGTWIDCEENTPGFNFFESESDLIRYLPRFKVRAHRLYMCHVSMYDIIRNPKSNYTLAKKMFIRRSAWRNRIIGSDLL